MICPKCGEKCLDGSSFCVKCGANLKEYNTQNYSQPVQNNDVNNTGSSFYNKQINNMFQQGFQQPNQINSNINNVKTKSLNYLKYLTTFLLKPFKTYNEEENKLSDTKTSIIFSIIIGIIMMIITLIKSMLTQIFAKTFDYTTLKYKTGVNFSNLKNLNYMNLIGRNLLIYVGIIFAIAVVYYLASLVLKKSINFNKLLSISASSIIPYIVIGMIISPILGMIWSSLYIVGIVIGIVYSVLIFINLVNEEINFNSTDEKIHFHLVCLSIIIVALYYLYINIFISAINKTSLDSILDLFS